MKSADPVDYWFADWTGIEIVTNGISSAQTKSNYRLYCDLLAAGKRVWGCAGSDFHACCSNSSLTTVYAREKKNAAYMEALRVGDFTAGPVGIRMCVGETRMGGETSFEGERLVLSVGNFHCSVANPEHRYQVEILSDRGVELTAGVSCKERVTLAIPTEADRAFYRTTVTDCDRGLILAYGNPIWNKK